MKIIFFSNKQLDIFFVTFFLAYAGSLYASVSLPYNDWKEVRLDLSVQKTKYLFVQYSL